MSLSGIAQWRVGRGQEHLAHARNMAQNAALDTRIELGQRIVQQNDRGASDSLFDGGRFREAQCQRHQALLSPRSERSEVTSLQSNQKIISMGTNERLAPADFLRKAGAQ
jgi:hypothetical protein